MLKIKSQCSLWAVLLAAVCLPLAAWAGSPKDSADSFFRALAKGDVQEARKYSSDKVLQEAPPQGSEEYLTMTVWGKAYKSLENVKINEDIATATVHLDGKLIVDHMVKLELERKKADTKDQSELATIKGHMEASAPRFAKKMSKLPVTLKKQGDTWLIQQMQ
ncbi:MAG: hypothetical protein K9K65_01975 [Desulfarculaceae bacterium]|nr:hypothetical protein [Desulfarculaceae bacterium]MCF8064406.1 hypothetical protein [Desulfarculaceae bacterium]MCF8096586.1 hypothetical protein [Desulfarculaceae bacterium]MCF8122244.1 hypothetical protein [Desulfarculaceae bacterium]